MENELNKKSAIKATIGAAIAGLCAVFLAPLPIYQKEEVNSFAAFVLNHVHDHTAILTLSLIGIVGMVGGIAVARFSIPDEA
ncbi:hypothetical protein [Rhizobium leguminosarum]|uniref:hypothetical protein n=1 Tax=Rhizobium leguminosarum TaxID=384 RepID=UPI002E11095C|nr:hypothetical protein U8Q02_43590 [Rhizobium leguminosarum]